LEQLKPQYFAATDPAQKRDLKSQIDSLIAQLTHSAGSGQAHGNQQFDFEIYFSEVFHHNGGFDVVIGNPPYVVSNDKQLRKIYQESIHGRPNLYGFFMHRGIASLLRPNGVLTFINPRTLLTDSYTSALRRFIIKNARVRLVLNIVDRRNVFTSVLQSTIVDIFQKTHADIPVRVKSIKTKEDLERSNEIQISTSDFLFGDLNPIFVVASDINAYSIFHKIKSLKSFEQVGLSFTTGKIQWDLYKDVLSDRQTSRSTRLIWAENIQRYRIGENRTRLDKLFINAPLQNCSPITEKTIVVQRVTAVEQPWRIIATLVSPKEFGIPIQSENHTSYLERNSERLDLRFVLGLMNSALFDFLFRHINSNTQVSAGELNSLPFPKPNQKSEEEVIKLVDRILAAKKANPAADTSTLEAEIDQLVYQLYGLTAEEIAIVEGA
jgi:Alw26I/Eco31I/Esp3I family type II restriction m6 adenine DNA methyltransferase